jgi:uncharacterized iron-regulated protein
METMFLLPLFLIQAEGPDPHNLPIGRPGTTTVAVGAIKDMRTLASADVDSFAVAADGYRYVFVGESHDHPEHHKMQAAVIEALVKRGRDVVVGFEMFTRPVQNALGPWTLGKYTESQFVVEADWQKQWGFPFEIYAPIFRATQKHRLPMVALNVPRDWVRSRRLRKFDSRAATTTSRRLLSRQQGARVRFCRPYGRTSPNEPQYLQSSSVMG